MWLTSITELETVASVEMETITKAAVFVSFASVVTQGYESWVLFAGVLLLLYGRGKKKGGGGEYFYPGRETVARLTKRIRTKMARDVNKISFQKKK